MNQKNHPILAAHGDPRRLGLREFVLTLTCLAITLTASGFFIRDLVLRWEELAFWGRFELAAFGLVVFGLIYGNIAFQIARLGWTRRIRGDEGGLPQPSGDAPSLAILVPSYREEPDVVRQTLLSAALQAHAKKRIVLLIDDPTQPDSEQAKRLLTEARNLPKECAELFAAWRSFAKKAARVGTRESLAEFVAWFAADLRILKPEGGNHVDRFFAEKVIEGRIEWLRSLPDDPATAFAAILALLDAEFSSFERKRFVNLSHEPNKAMNLNAYLGLMGGRYAIVRHRDGDHLVRNGLAAPDQMIEIPDSEFVLTLDADSLLLPGYAETLVGIMVREGNERLAVIQTPYSAVPGAGLPLERIAGATTDVQLLIHQGFTQFSATFWVGANAVLRRPALEDIREVVVERGFAVPRYIHDRTVIEDTESTIDLVAKGWQLSNHPERLAYSATPPDFGSLLIQRRRWANGGLIILPKLLGYVLRSPFKRAAEGFLRVHYLASIALTSLGLLALLVYPFTNAPYSVWLPLSALPYFLLYGRDLVLSGYRPFDIFRVYALNLLLVPVNLGGVFKSLQQGLTRRKIPFGRTPKIKDRTAVPAAYAWAVLGLFGICLFAMINDLLLRHWAHAAFAGLNAAILGYAVAAFVGLRPLATDCLPQRKSKALPVGAKALSTAKDAA